MLNRLPGVIALARQRARELWTCPVHPRQRRRYPPWAVARFATPSDTAQRVSLLCGDDLSVMSGLLSGQAQDGPLAGRVSMICMDHACEADPATGRSLNAVQRRVRALIELATRMYLARELLAERGCVVVRAHTDADRCVQRLQEAVFGHCRVLAPRDNRSPDLCVHLSGDQERLGDIFRQAWPGEWVRHGSERGDQVLVLGAEPSIASWVTSLDRRWVLVQRDPLTFYMLREHIVARQLDQTGQRLARETRLEWPALQASPEGLQT